MPLVKLKPGQPRKTPRKGSSCKSYTHSPGQSNGTLERSRTVSAIAQTIARNVGPNRLWWFTASDRTLVDCEFDGTIRVRRYLCRLCKRTVSLLPEFALPWLRLSITVISLFLVAHLLQGLTF